MNALAGSLIRGVDPVALAYDVGLDLDPWQREVARSRDDTLVGGGRQIGKSTIAALVAVHEALYERGALVLLVAPAHRQSLETFRSALGLYKALGRPVPAETENTMSLTLENGSRILALPGSETTLRGYGAVSLIVLDEAARVPDDLLHAVLPMLAVSRGRIVAISTPVGPRGWFYEAWSDDKSRWERHAIRSDECPRIDRDWLEEQRRIFPAAQFAREFEVSFMDPEGAAFRREDIDAAFDGGIETWNL